MSVQDLAASNQDVKDNLNPRDTTKNVIFKVNTENINIEENSTRILSRTHPSTGDVSFILGNSTHGKLGTGLTPQPKLGQNNYPSDVVIRVINPNNTFREHFRDTTFLDSGDMKWDTTNFRLSLG